MKLTVIWLPTDDEGQNQKTIASLADELKNLSGGMQLVAYASGQDEKNCAAALPGCELIWLDREGKSDVECYNDAMGRTGGDYVTALAGGDSFEHGAFVEIEKAAAGGEPIVMPCKMMPTEKPGAFAAPSEMTESVRISLTKDFRHYPFYFGGTFLSAKCFKSRKFDASLGLDSERDYFLRTCMDVGHVMFCPQVLYMSGEMREWDSDLFRDAYEREWYLDSFERFWFPFLEELSKRKGGIPRFVQYHLMFSVRNRIYVNWNNRNKHVIDEEEGEQVLSTFGKAFSYIDDMVLYNSHKVSEANVNDTLKWIYGILKYGQDFRFDKYYLSGKPYYGTANTLFNSIANLKTNIQFCNYEDGKLSIDGTVHPILFSMAEKISLRFGGKDYPLTYNGRYSHYKTFGVSIYKRHPFHAEFDMKDVRDVRIACIARVGGEEVVIPFSYESHFSRISGEYQNSYWTFGADPMYMALKEEDGGIRIKVSGKKQKRRQELRLELEMLRSFKKRAWLFFIIRRAVFAAKPFMKRHPIWMYIDKIYKAGDSSEYLYRYACAQHDGNKHYYLVDKKSPDYKRLKKEGYHPLVRGSVKHRLVFLLSDMMVISNSTVFAFNNFGLPNSAQVRDIVDFHVCCVQHGMSVQKIAVAQNRLRDNTRLYFCASKYEIENLSRPVYDYVGYDALKLTGVPRYDGLVDDDKKQIMISPTWRMQAAAQVRTSEGEQRDYNPLFKESTYYKVFNALINDPRLIEAAKKYGYRIKYVLHPIVSSQVDDFDKNDYVDIIPAAGDMSYERMFCESSLMVTDFSGIQFDFAYMRKPIVYLHHRDIPQHYEEGTFFYDTMAFGEIACDNDELIDLLIEYMENGCKMKEEYVRRADDFFNYSDHENCKRIYDVMTEYQDKHVLRNGR